MEFFLLFQFVGLLSHSLGLLILSQFLFLGKVVLLLSPLLNLLFSVFSLLLMKFLLKLEKFSLYFFFSVPAYLFDCSQSSLSFIYVSVLLILRSIRSQCWGSLCSYWSLPVCEFTIGAISEVQTLVLPSVVSHSCHLHLTNVNWLIDINVWIQGQLVSHYLGHFT